MLECHGLFGQEADHGFIAVSFFFVLSGFVLTYSYSGSDGRMRGTRSAFYLARFARIYPAYLLAAIAAIPLFFLALRQVHTLAGTLMRVAAGGTLVAALVQSWLPRTANYLNSPAWSLSVEAFFYLLFPLILPLITGLSKPRIASFLVLSWILLVLPPIADLGA